MGKNRNGRSILYLGQTLRINEDMQHADISRRIRFAWTALDKLLSHNFRNKNMNKFTTNMKKMDNVLFLS